MEPVSLNVNRTNYVNYGNIKPAFPNFEEEKAPLSYSSYCLSGEMVKQEIKANEAIEKRLFDSFLKQPHKITQEEYEDIVKNHPLVLSNAYDYYLYHSNCSTSPEDLAIVVNKVDKYLKENYKNCRIISLGTSPAALCEQLAALGYDITFVPVSGFKYLDEEIVKPEELPNIKAILEYIKSKNVDDNKDTIILDYVSTGKTLNLMSDLISSYCDIPTDSIHKLPLGELLKKSFKDCNFKERFAKVNFAEDVGFQSIDNFSNVPHFSIAPESDGIYKSKGNTIWAKNKSYDELFKEFDNYTTPLARAFSLCAMHEYMKLNENLD